jgi:hypothetical protein
MATYGHPRTDIGAVTTRLTVTVPQGITGGDLVRVAAPDGSYHSIMVPGGLMSGQQFSVELLATSNHSAEVQKLRLELDAERALRRETQQEVLRNRSVRRRARCRTRGLAGAPAHSCARAAVPPSLTCAVARPPSRVPPGARGLAGEARCGPRLLPRHAQAATKAG